ncbi:hypothetical protein [Nostoc sp.]|uniref:hypothetical protein n=1 Tax=Nostoc sp. TaxID=1180 RepID=UPI002FF8879D
MKVNIQNNHSFYAFLNLNTVIACPLSESALWILGQYLSQLGLSTEPLRPSENG